MTDVHGTREPAALAKRLRELADGIDEYFGTPPDERPNRNWIGADVELLRDAAAVLARDGEPEDEARRDLDLRLTKRQIEKYAICLDHRDKGDWSRCIVCKFEESARSESAALATAVVQPSRHVSCECPAGYGKDCPLTAAECTARVEARRLTAPAPLRAETACPRCADIEKRPESCPDCFGKRRRGHVR